MNRPGRGRKCLQTVHKSSDRQVDMETNGEGKCHGCLPLAASKISIPSGYADLMYISSSGYKRCCPQR
jgi:hypothetical protein